MLYLQSFGATISKIDNIIHIYLIFSFLLVIKFFLKSKVDVPIKVAVQYSHKFVITPDNTASRQVVQDRNKSSLSFLTVTAVTFSNGGDNIGVFVPLFSKYNTVSQITTLTAVFVVMTAVWCIASYYFVNHPLIASIRHIGNIILPFVLIGLGIYILAESFLLTWSTIKHQYLETLYL